MGYFSDLFNAVLGRKKTKSGRPKGSGTLEQKISDYVDQNPDASVSEIAHELNISRTSVYKWTEQEQEKSPEPKKKKAKLVPRNRNRTGRDFSR